MKPVLSLILVICLSINFALSEIECDSSCLSGQCLIPNDPNYCLECPGISSIGESISKVASSNESKAMTRNLGEKRGNFELLNLIRQSSIKNSEKLSLNSRSNSNVGLREEKQETIINNTKNKKINRRLEDSVLTNNQIVLLMMGIDSSSFRGYGYCVPVVNCTAPNIVIKRLNATSYCFNMLSAESLLNSFMNMFDYFLGIIFPSNMVSENNVIDGLFQTFDNIAQGNLPLSSMTNSPSLIDSLLPTLINKNPALMDIALSLLNSNFSLKDQLLSIILNANLSIPEMFVSLFQKLQIGDELIATFINEYIVELFGGVFPLLESHQLDSQYFLTLLSESLSNFTIPQIFYTIDPNNPTQIIVQINNSQPYFDISFNIDATPLIQFEGMAIELFTQIMTYYNISLPIELSDITVDASVSFKIGCKDLIIDIYAMNSLAPIPLTYEYIVQNFTDILYNANYQELIRIAIQEITQILQDNNIILPDELLLIPQIFISESEVKINYTLPIPPIPIDNQSHIMMLNVQLSVSKIDIVNNCGLCKFRDKQFCESLKGICYPYNYLDFNLPEQDTTGYASFLIHSPTCLKNVGPYCINTFNAIQSMNITWKECNLFFTSDDYLIAMNDSRILDENREISFGKISDAMNPKLGIKFNTSLDLIGSNLCSDYIQYFKKTKDNSELIEIPNDKCVINIKNHYNKDINRRDSILYLTFDPSIELVFNGISFKQNMLMDNIFSLPLNNLPQISVKDVLPMEISFSHITTEKFAHCMPLKGTLKNFINSIYHNIVFYVPNPNKEVIIDKINAQLQYFNNLNSFLIPSEMTSTLTSLEIHVKYNILNSEYIIDKSSTISFENSISPIIIPKILYQVVYLYNEVIEDKIEFYLISDCAKPTNLQLITEFTVQVSSTDSQGITTDYPTLVTNYTNSLKKFNKIIFDPSTLIAGNNYTISIQPLD